MPASKFMLDTSSFQSLNFTPGLFSIAQGGAGAGRVGGTSTDSELYILYSAVPEPGALALAGIGIAATAWWLRRRRPR